MQLVETINEGLKRGYEAKISAADLDTKVIQKLEASRSEIQLKGFN